MRGKSGHPNLPRICGCRGSGLRDYPPEWRGLGVAPLRRPLAA
ncbi:gp191 [Mycobacterium phage Omega]|uniref:Uncharacterized protein n=1 Tax=Mycobacterium phage Omega TaxID=2907835 RepID=Q853X4_BPMOM|nr:gp191 [Mycobacterium phage Omega]AAN12834.1 hypothetical protein PBI_OMEGA_191 [Mycobacterium phage Omega]